MYVIVYRHTLYYVCILWHTWYNVYMTYIMTYMIYTKQSMTYIVKYIHIILFNQVNANCIIRHFTIYMNERYHWWRGERLILLLYDDRPSVIGTWTVTLESGKPKRWKCNYCFLLYRWCSCNYSLGNQEKLYYIFFEYL